MDLNFKSMPFGSLPYDDINLCKQMMLKLYENIPYLPELPLIDKNDNIIHKTFSNIPCVQIKEGKIIIPESNDSKLFDATNSFDKFFNSNNLSDFDKYSIEAPFLNLYFEMLKRIKPKYTAINIIGPFSFASMIFNRNPVLFITEKTYRKFIIQTICLKALWFISKVKECSPQTKPIIIFEENLLYKFGTLKRTSELITKDLAVSLMAKVFQRIKNAGGVVCVQSFEKCNWQLVFETQAVDMISFDAYNNPNNLSIIAQEVQKFLVKGGVINWGIVPVTSENIIKSMNIDMLHRRFVSTVDSLASEGVSSDLLYNNSTVSLQGNTAKLPILFAEKALILCHQLSKKI